MKKQADEAKIVDPMEVAKIKKAFAEVRIDIAGYCRDRALWFRNAPDKSGDGLNDHKVKFYEKTAEGLEIKI